jgi:hypothetical protein
MIERMNEFYHASINYAPNALYASVNVLIVEERTLI